MKPGRTGIKWMVALMLLIAVTAASFASSAADKSLQQLISEAKSQKVKLAAEKKSLKKEWNKNKDKLSDIADFREVAQKNAEKGVIALGSRLMKDVIDAFAKNHGYKAVSKLVGYTITSNEDVSKTTVSWANLKRQCDKIIEETQKKNKNLLSEMKIIDDKVDALDKKIRKWQKAYDKATGNETKEYDYEAALAKWTADYQASASHSSRDEYWGVDHVFTLKFTIAPSIKKNGQYGPGVYGAHEVWDHYSFYAGEYAGRVGDSTVNTFGGTSTPDGIYMSLGDLRSKYPQFEPK
jgi:hypothetical protein